MAISVHWWGYLPGYGRDLYKSFHTLGRALKGVITETQRIYLYGFVL